MWATASATAAAVDLRGIGATLGIETLVWLSDMGGLSREEAVEVMRSKAHTLLRAAVANL